MKRVSGRGGRLVLLAALMTAAGACSLVVEQRDRQCASDGDCARLSPGSVCRDEVCVAPASTCASGEPTTPAQFLNRCTGAQCIPFDNCARLGLCNGQPRPARLDPPSP
ncbi:MAG: hypothetical protein EOO75_18250 [Myxococcales bacterium]|nr:MAG: hypothetical protein EOO75_18250 [Myxococcales bacterium]